MFLAKRTATTCATLSLLLAVAHSSAFIVPFVGPRHGTKTRLKQGTAPNLVADRNESELSVSRRSIVNDAVLAVCGFGSLATFSAVPPAFGSGGATAGGAYLLSAKQRYNQRVEAGVKTFLGMDARHLDEVNAFFADEGEGGWKDVSAAGYLLANAFRRSSSTPPDSLPSVKKWKAFQKEVDSMQKALTKKKGDAVFIAYKNAESALDEYLEAVELPSVADMRQ